MTYRLLGGPRVIESSAFIAAPMAGLRLAQYGADVIRVDMIGGGLDYARLPRMLEGQSLYWTRYSTVRELLASDERVSLANPVFETLQTPGIGQHLAAGATARLAGHEREPTPPAPLLGTHTDEVLQQVLGLDSCAVGRLHDKGIVAGPQRDPSLKNER